MQNFDAVMGSLPRPSTDAIDILLKWVLEESVNMRCSTLLRTQLFRDGIRHSFTAFFAESR